MYCTHYIMYIQYSCFQALVNWKQLVRQWIFFIHVQSCTEYFFLLQHQISQFCTVPLWRMHHVVYASARVWRVQLTNKIAPQPEQYHIRANLYGVS